MREENTVINDSLIKQTDINALPEFGFVRIKKVLEVFPVSKSTWWEGVKNGRYPQPIKLGPKITAWDVEDIRALVESCRKNKKIQSAFSKPTKGPRMRK